MNRVVSTIATKAINLVGAGEQVLAALEAVGWPDDRPEREEYCIESTISVAHILADREEMEMPAMVRLPDEIRIKYNKWFSACLGLVSANMEPRSAEVAAANQDASRVLNSDYMDFEDQLLLARCIRRMNAIVSSVPDYIDGRLHDLKMAISEVYIGDELNEASTLLHAGYIRCAGEITGVLLERHLKLVCQRQQPPIKYGQRDGITKLNDKLRDTQVYDLAQWRRVQWMGDLRNACDHPGKSEPRKEDVADLMSGVRKFISLV